MPIFDGINLIITLDSGLTNFDWIDIYTAWKSWLLESPVNRGYPPAFRTTGGDPISATLEQGAYWFLRNDLGWRIKPPEENISAYPSGNLVPEDASLPVAVPTDGNYTTFYLGLQPITQGVSSTAIATAVRDELDLDLKTVLGLNQQNFRLVNQVYDSLGNMTLGTVKLYNTAADCDADINAYVTYSITATYSGQNCTSYKVTKD